MKTQAELKALKDNWLSDPCWDIEDTEGFEEHKEELLKFRKEKEESEWEARRYHLLEKSKSFSVFPNVYLAEYLEGLENRIKSLEERLYSLENISDVEKSRRRM